MEWEDEIINNFWELTMEDRFLGLLTFNDNQEDLSLTKQSKEQLKEAGFKKIRVLVLRNRKTS